MKAVDRLLKIAGPVELALGISLAVYLGYTTGDILLTSLGAFVAWKGLLVSHYIFTGEVVDRRTTSHESIHNKVFLAAGILAMVIAFPTVIVALNREFFPLVFAGELIFVSGHMVGHYGFSGKYW